MDRQHRRDLKHDKFVDEVGSLTQRARDNQRILVTITVSAVVVAVVAYGIYFYRSNRERQAQDALGAAIEAIESPIIQPGQPPMPGAKYRSDDERSKAAETLFRNVQSKFAGSDAADVAGLYIARITAARGDVATARKMLQHFVDEHPKQILVAPARYSLYEIRIDNGEAQQVINELNQELARTENQVLPPDSLLSLLAHAYDVQGNTDKSLDAWRRIATQFPDSPYALDAQRRIGSSATS